MPQIRELIENINTETPNNEVLITIINQLGSLNEDSFINDYLNFISIISEVEPELVENMDFVKTLPMITESWKVNDFGNLLSSNIES